MLVEGRQNFDLFCHDVLEPQETCGREVSVLIHELQGIVLTVMWNGVAFEQCRVPVDQEIADVVCWAPHS